MPTTLMHHTRESNAADEMKVKSKVIACMFTVLHTISYSLFHSVFIHSLITELRFVDFSRKSLIKNLFFFYELTTLFIINK